MRERGRVAQREGEIERKRKREREKRERERERKKERGSVIQRHREREIEREVDIIAMVISLWLRQACQFRQFSLCCLNTTRSMLDGRKCKEGVESMLV